MKRKYLLLGGCCLLLSAGACICSLRVLAGENAVPGLHRGDVDNPTEHDLSAALPDAINRLDEVAMPADFTACWQAGTVVTEVAVQEVGLDKCFCAEPISDAVFRRMWQKSWKDYCTLSRNDLRYLKLLHRNADGLPQLGEMVVNTVIADKVVEIFRQLYDAGYRIERMLLIDHYDADDEKAMTDNDTSCFNFRFMTGSTSKISKHGLGLAIDINPLYNPYVKQRADGTYYVSPAAGEPYALHRDRADFAYKIDHNDLAYRLFTAAGFEWGGDWKSLKDYQHFEIELKKE